VEAPELKAGDVIGFAPHDLLPRALYSFGMHDAFRTQIWYNAMDILRVRVHTTLRLKPQERQCMLSHSAYNSVTNIETKWNEKQIYQTNTKTSNTNNDSLCNWEKPSLFQAKQIP